MNRPSLLDLPQVEPAPRHLPADPNRFNFDEVAPFFQNMAQRSIPLYEEAHRMHTSMLRPWIMRDGASILDVGASRGRFVDHIVDSAGTQRVEDGRLHITAIDNSLPMCEALRSRHPHISVRLQDVSGDEFIYGGGTNAYDIVCAFYVLQFIHPEKQQHVLRRLVALVKEGGVLIIGQKSAHDGLLGARAHEYYLDWRTDNGYSREEIEAKSKALRGSMWPMRERVVRDILAERMTEVYETTRIGMFNTLIARK